MMLPLPLLVPFLVTVGWEAVPQGTRLVTEPCGGTFETCPTGGTFQTCPTGSSAWLPADLVWPSSANTDPLVGAPPALAPWRQASSWDLQFPTPVQSALTEATDPRPSPWPGWPPETLIRTPDQPGDQALRIPLAGSIFLFGQAEKDIVSTSQVSRFIGVTGVTWKLPVQAGLELLFSCGPELTYTDVLRPDRLQDRPSLPLQTRLLRLDVQCRWRLLGQVGLECQGSVCPALNPGEQDAFRQDLHLAFPLTGGGWFNVGAKHYWERSPDARQGPESGQLYGDFRLTW